MTFLLCWSRGPRSLMASICCLTLLLEFATSLLVVWLEWADRKTVSATDLSLVGAWLVEPKPPSVSTIAASHYRSPRVRPELGKTVVAMLWARHGSVLVIFHNVLIAFPSFPSACGGTEVFVESQGWHYSVIPRQSLFLKNKSAKKGNRCAILGVSAVIIENYTCL